MMGQSWMTLLGIRGPLLILGSILLLGGCGQRRISDPAVVLADTGETPARHEAAIRTLDATSGQERTVPVLRRMLVTPGYTVRSREAAFRALRRIDAEGLDRFLAIELPRLDSPAWRTRLCELIAEDGDVSMTPTLIRAWARPMPGWVGESEERPERLALIEMYGLEALPQVLVRVMLDADPIVAANLRARCWELLIVEGEREVVIDLLANAEVAANDGMFRDLRRIADDIGVVPVNREEIIWARSLCRPENAGFMEDVVQSVDTLPASRRATLELRDLGALVGADRIDPSWLAASEVELAAEIAARIGTEDRRVYSPDFTGWPGRFTERFERTKDRLDWGDLLAIRVAIEALSMVPIREHLFAHAERDLLDRRTELGGVIAIDDRGRFEVLEFDPRSRRADNRFEAPQDMFEAGYVGVFHFHHHAQDFDNREYAGPHMGDFAYADSTRANCLVFTFIDQDTLNADYYRHGRVVVDLAELQRPG